MESALVRCPSCGASCAVLDAAWVKCDHCGARAPVPNGVRMFLEGTSRMHGRRGFLHSVFALGLAGCNRASCIDRGSRRVFTEQTRYAWPRGELRGFARSGDRFYGLENAVAATEKQGAISDLCRLDLVAGTRERLRSPEGVRADTLAVSREHAWYVVQHRSGIHELHRAPLHPDGEPSPVFRVAGDVRFVAAGDRGAYTFRGEVPGQRELVRIADDGVVTVVAQAEPGALTPSASGIFYDDTTGLWFAPHDGPKKLVAERHSVPLLDGERPVLAVGSRIFELDPATGTKGAQLGDASSVAGQPCAALFGGFLVRAIGGSPGFSRSGQSTVTLNFFEPNRRGWTTAMSSRAGQHVFGTVLGATYLEITQAGAYAIG